MRQQLACTSEFGFRRGAEYTVVTDFCGATGKDVLEKAPQELDPGQSDVPHLLGTVVAIAETDHAVVDGFETAVGDGDAEHVTSQVVENLVATAGELGMNDPVFLPNRYRGIGEQSRLFQPITELSAKNGRQRRIRNQEFGVFGPEPGLSVGGEASGGDEHVNVRMKQHGAGPGVEDGQSADTRAQIAGIGREFLKSIGGGLHQ